MSLHGIHILIYYITGQCPIPAHSSDHRVVNICAAVFQRTVPLHSSCVPADNTAVYQLTAPMYSSCVPADSATAFQLYTSGQRRCITAVYQLTVPVYSSCIPADSATAFQLYSS